MSQQTKSPDAVLVSNVSFFYRMPRRTPLMSKIPLFSRLRMVNHTVLNELTLSIRENVITALVGRNGSGKTSLIKLIAGMRDPHQGKIEIFGKNPSHAKKDIGLCMGGTLIYHRLTGRENLEYFARLYNVENGAKRIEELSEMLELESALDDMVETYSFGMKAKLALARSLIHSPKLLILDEPTLGIDLHIAAQIRRFIRDLKCTVVLTSHYVDDIDQLAQDLCIIDKGRVLETGPKEEIIRRHGVDKPSEVFRMLVEKPIVRKVS